MSALLWTIALLVAGYSLNPVPTANADSVASDFLARKIRTYFQHFDFDGDGFVSKKDFEDIADRHSSGLSLDTAVGEKYKASLVAVWRQWMTSAGSDDNGLLTPSIMYESVKQLRNGPELKEVYLTMVDNFYGPLAVNGNGIIPKGQYVSAFAGIGIKDTSIIRRAFESTSLTHDGKLSYKDFANALYEYFTSEDEGSPFTMLWGPLL